MDIPHWLLTRGGDAQVAVFFAGLALFAGLEGTFPRRQGRQRRARWRTNAVLTGLAIAALALVPVSFIAAAVWAADRGIGLLNQVALPAWAIVAITLLVRGFVSTGTHWLNHKIPWLWRIHRVHHLDTEMDVTTTVRFHPLELLVGPVIGVPVVVAFGLSPWVLAFYELLDVIVTLFSHSNLRVPPGWSARSATSSSPPIFTACTTPPGGRRRTATSALCFRYGTSCSAHSARRRATATTGWSSVSTSSAEPTRSASSRSWSRRSPRPRAGALAQALEERGIVTSQPATAGLLGGSSYLPPCRCRPQGPPSGAGPCSRARHRWGRNRGRAKARPYGVENTARPPRIAGRIQHRLCQPRHDGAGPR